MSDEAAPKKRPKVKWWMIPRNVKRGSTLRSISYYLLSQKEHGPFNRLKNNLIRAHACITNMQSACTEMHYELARKELVEMRELLDEILIVDMPPNARDSSNRRKVNKRRWQYMLKNQHKYPHVNFGAYTSKKGAGEA